MKVVNTAIPDVLLLEPKVFSDARGLFFESYNRKMFADLTGVSPDFVQDNHSRSTKGVLRGLHYQIEQPQGKLVRVAKGRVFDVAVDMRKNSSTFGAWVGAILSDENHHMLWIPSGFAHGFLVMSGEAEFLYKTTDYYSPRGERCVRWNDPHINIKWPIEDNPLLSAKDQAGCTFIEADVFE